MVVVVVVAAAAAVVVVVAKLDIVKRPARATLNRPSWTKGHAMD